MESAFGVDHGDVEIAKFGMPKIPKMPGLGGGVSSIGRGLSTMGSKIGNTTANLGRKSGAFGGGQLKRGRLKTAGIAGSAGNRLRGAGTAMAKNPMATGVGVTAGVGGAAGGAALAHTPDNKKLQQFR